MLIGIDASRANRERKTGTEWYSYYLIEGLKKFPLQKGINFLLYSAEPLKDKLNNLPFGWQEKVLFWWPKYLWTQARLSLEMLLRPVDLLFVPAHTLPIIHPKKTVITLHDLAFEKFPQFYSFGQRKYLRFVYQFAVKKATRIIVPSWATKNDLEEIYQADPKKIVVIPLAYNKEEFKVINNQNKIDQVLRKYGIKKPYFLFIGRLEKKKGIEILLKAFHLFLSEADQFRAGTYNNSITFNFVLVGKPGYGYDEIKSQIPIRQPAGKCQIQTIGYVEQNDLPYLYNGAEIFIFPTFAEGFGLPILEAMACGIPVIASEIEPLKEIGGEAIIFFKSGDSEDLAEKIKGLINNQELRKSLIQKGLEQVKNFSWQKCAQETLNLLISL